MTGPDSFLNIRHQPLWFVLLAFVVVYGGGYLLSWLFYRLNLKLSWIWYRDVARKTEKEYRLRRRHNGNPESGKPCGQ